MGLWMERLSIPSYVETLKSAKRGMDFKLVSCGIKCGHATVDQLFL